MREGAGEGGQAKDTCSSRQDRHGTRVAAAKDVTDRIKQVMLGQPVTNSALLGLGEESSNSCDESQEEWKQVS